MVLQSKKVYNQLIFLNIYYTLCLSVCLFVCIKPINAKTAKLIGPKFFMGPNMIPEKVYVWLDLNKCAFNKFSFFKSTKKKVNKRATIKS